MLKASIVVKNKVFILLLCGLTMQTKFWKRNEYEIRLQGSPHFSRKAFYDNPL